MKKIRFLAIGALLALSACEVPSLQQRQLLDSVVGKAEVDVIRQFGVPSRTFQAGGHDFLAYIDNQTQYSSGGGGWGWGGWGGPWGGGWGGPAWGGIGGGFGAGGFPSTYYTSSCQTTFELNNGRVMGWTMHGDGC